MKFFISILVLLSFFSPVQSNKAPQDSVNIQNIHLKEVVIQSFKQRGDLRLEPLSASSVSGTSIRNRNVTGIKELSSFIPNLFMPDYGSKLTSPVFIRGIGSKINSPSVGLYIDGIPYFEKSAFDFEFTEIDKIEVLRGPQGTLYGRNTMGGIINVFTKSPLNYQGTNIKLSNGNYGNQDYSLSHYQLINHQFGIAVSGNYHHQDGYFTNQYTDKKADGMKSGSARIRIEWKPNERLTLGLMNTYDRSNQGGYPYAVCDSLTNKPGKVNYNDYSYYKRAVSTTGFSADYEGRGFQMNSRTAFQYISDHQGIDQDFTEKAIYFARQDMKQKMLSEEFNIKSTSNGRYKWLLGAFGFWQGIDNIVTLNYLKKGFTTRKFYDTPTYGIAFYHQSTIDHLFTDGISLTFGIRYDYEHASDDYQYYRITDEKNEQADSFKEKLKFNQVTPKIALQYIFPCTGILYATVAKGYKTGGFNTSFDRDEDRTFQPESSWNYEIGAKHPFLDNRLNAEVSIFWIDWKNQQIYQMLATQNGQFLRNAGRSQSKGVEFSLRANPINGLMMNLNYGFTHATFKNYKDERKNIDYSGNYLPLVPKHTFAASANYTLANPFPQIDRFTFSVNYTGTGKIYWKENNEMSQGYYGLLDAKASVTKKFLTVALWAKNITNASYSTYFFESGGKKLAQKGRPFTLGANIELSF